MADDHIKSALLKQVATVSDHYSLQEFSPFKTGGVADYFTVAHTAVEVAAAVKAAIDVGIAYRVIGTSSKILFSDGGYPGLIIHNKTQGYGVALDKSQIVVDAGLPLSRFITAAAGMGLGGMTQFYGEEGTIGGALYSNIRSGESAIRSNLRYMTVIMPPSRIDKEPTINRYKSDWLESEEWSSRLRELRETKDDQVPQPVILTALFQLTSVRSDEIRLRLHDKMQKNNKIIPKGVFLGPLFLESPGVPILEMIQGVKATTLRVGAVSLDARYPLCMRAKGSVRAADIRELITKVQDLVEGTYGVRPVCRYEFVGVW